MLRVYSPIRRQWSTHSNHFLIRTVVIWAVTWGNTSWQHQLGNQQSHIHWQGLWCCLLLLHLPHWTQRFIRHLKLIFVVTWRSPAHCADFECHLFNHGNRLCFFIFLIEDWWLLPQIALTYHWVAKCLHKSERGYKGKQDGSADIYSAMQWYESIITAIVRNLLKKKKRKFVIIIVYLQLFVVVVVMAAQQVQGS